MIKSSNSAHNEKLWKLFDDYHEFQLKIHPEDATFDGDNRYDDRLFDYKEEKIEEFYGTVRKYLEELLGIDRNSLSREDKLNYDLFRYNLESRVLEGEKFGYHLMPLWQQEGIHITLIYLSELQPCRTDEDVKKFILRLKGFDKQVDDTIVNIRKGIKSGLVMPDFIIEQILPQIESLTSTKPEESVFFASCSKSRDVSQEVAYRLIDTITKNLYPAYKKLYDFIKNEYLPGCRKEEGIWALPDGEERYKHSVKFFTSLDLDPEAIHRTGLDEVVRIEKEMTDLIGDLKFTGSISEFNEHLRNNPAYYFVSKDDLMEAYRMILKKMDSKLPEIFGRLPKKGYDLREIDKSVADSAPAAYYMPASLDGSRPGYFYVNTSNLNARPKYEMTALALHEAVPGHHLQIALAQELTSLPQFRRDWGGHIAYGEGWALYSESLGYQTGMYDDLYQRYGALSMEIWRACRLVVDTGIHHKKWTREQAVEFMKQHSPNPEHDIRAEVDRYIAWPGQALAYKIGELKIKELRNRAETALNSKFRLKDFHDTILLNGAMPLAYLEKIVDEWIDTVSS